ncbi:hypothetical protein I7I51_07401 [Histoplasma capsulatum]|uniref:Uncharacterized protein n=1 Tax=Ajellomyces capsulatus TaxID=5037 RepID=A0A8A1M0N3_AJECA|nr:hypothetical protein I7I51_07401 [Histoplasma capsulatum]
MADKLDKSLDDILSSRRTARRTSQRRRDTRSTRASHNTAPVGGVKKTVRNAKSTSKSIPTGPSMGLGESKIIVSGLPSDVGEANIKQVELCLHLATPLHPKAYLAALHNVS